MKRQISILLCLILILTVAGCGNDAPSGKQGSKQPAGVNDVLQQGMAEADNKDNEEIADPEPSPAPDPVQVKAPIPDDDIETIDVDLTVLSSTMVYSEVYNMMFAPEGYIGKTVKMKGQFATYHDELTGNDYFACIVQDATACCVQGIEFVLTEDYTYPDDYPEIDSEICVAGVFDTYQEDGFTYCTLRNASLL